MEATTIDVLPRPPFGTAQSQNLGGALRVAASPEVEAVRNTTTYQGLRRAWPLPALSGDDDDAIDLYRTARQEECPVSWTHSMESNGRTSFVFRVHTDDKGRNIELGYHLNPKIEYFQLDDSGDQQRGNEKYAQCHCTGDDGTQVQVIQQDREFLFSLVPLRIFWAHGAVLCGKYPSAFWKICTLERNLCMEQPETKKWSLLWNLILADVALTIDNDTFLRQHGGWDRALAFQGLGETIEAVKSRFGLAACVYELGASLATTDPVVRGCLLCCAGLAAKREGDFDTSESHYLAAMREHVLVEDDAGHKIGVREDLNAEHCTQTLSNTLLMYERWREVSGGTLLPSSSPAEPWLCLLLARVKYLPPNPTASAMIRFYESKIIAKKLSHEKAKRHLLAVLRCTTVPDYHAKLLQVRALMGKKAAAAPVPLYPIVATTTTPNSPSEQRQYDKKKAKALLQTTSSLARCFGCREQVDLRATMICNRCKCAFYCGKDCQVAHWHNGHKEECKKAAATQH